MPRHTLWASSIVVLTGSSFVQPGDTTTDKKQLDLPRRKLLPHGVHHIAGLVANQDLRSCQ